MQRRELLIGGGAIAVAGAIAGYAGIDHLASMTDYDAAVEAMRAAPARPARLYDIIRFATLAANGHNTQPWRFRIGADRIDILPDFTRRTPAVDPDDHHLFVSLGCAAENLWIAAAACGRTGRLDFDTATHAAAFIYGEGRGSETALLRAIPKRQSTRSIYDGRPVPTSQLAALAAAADMDGVDLVLITDRPAMDRVRDLVVAGNTIQMHDAAFTRELKSWLRFNPAAALRSGDGLFTSASGNPILPDWLGPRLFDLSYDATSSNDQYARQLRSSSGIAVFVGRKSDRHHWFLAGRACQRFALQATALGLKHAFINQPVEVTTLRPQFASLVGLPARRPDVVMRFGHASPMPYSARRPVRSILAT